MFTADDTRYGRLFVLAAAVVFLTSCEARQSARQSLETPATVQPVVAPDSAAPVRPAADRSEQLELLAIGDSIGPRPLDTSRVGTTQLRNELAEEGTTADTIAGRFLVVKPIPGTPRLLYRASRRDTVWTELDGLLDYYEHGDQTPDIQIRQANLDGQGRPEVLVHFYSAIYGSGGGSTYASDYVLDITNSPPQLLLQASTRYIQEAFPAYAAMHGEPLEADQVEEGYERTVKLQGREVLVGPIKAEGRDPEPSDREELTQLPAGRYRYQNGRVFRVRK